MRSILFVLALTLLAAPAYADDHDSPPRIQLTATAGQDAAQDSLQANLNASVRSVTAKAAQEEVNELMTQALNLARTYKDIEITTGAYSTYENQRDRVWFANQRLILKSKDSEALLDLVGKLQERNMKLQNLSFYLSRDAREQLTNTLLVEALSNAKARAQIIAKTVGARDIRVHTVNHHEHGGARPPMMQRICSVLLWRPLLLISTLKQRACPAVFWLNLPVF